MSTDAGRRAGSIEELRAVARGLLEQLDVRGEALMVVASGVVVINERYADQKAVSTAIAAGVVDEHVVRSVYAPSHEAVHMIQLLTSRFVLHLGFELFNLCGVTANNRSRRRPEVAWLPAVLRDYRKAQHQLTSNDGARFSTLQVLEAQAVLEGFRGGFSLHSPEGLALVMRLAHEREPTYTQVIDAFVTAHGFELTLEVLPRLCWLALDDSAPGLWLSKALETLRTDDIRWLANASAVATCNAFGQDPAVLATSWRRRRPAIADHPLHALLRPYFDKLETETDAEAMLRRAMHPGRAGPPNARVRMADLMPPVAVYADDVFLMNGPYRDSGWDVAEPLVRSSAIVISTLAWLDARSQDDSATTIGN